MPFRFRPPLSDDAAMILGWRTRPDITRFMVTDIEDPDVERQKAWLAAEAGRADVRHFVVEAEGRPIGFSSFVEIDRRHRRCAVGSYVADPADRRRFAGLLPTFHADYAFRVLGMNKIVNSFLEGNERVIRYQRLLGYRDVGVFRRHVWKYGRWHDVYVLELLREIYEARPRVFPLADTLAAFGLAADGTPAEGSP